MTAPKSKKDKINWQEAMFNEAEASNNAQWAKETRWAALFQPVRDSFALWSKADGGLTYWINLPFLYILANKALNWASSLQKTETSDTLMGTPLSLLAIIFLSGSLFGIFNKKNLIFVNMSYWIVYCGLDFIFSDKNLPLITSLEFLIATTSLLSIGYWLGQQLRIKLKI